MMDDQGKLLKMMKADHIIDGDDFCRKISEMNDTTYIVSIDKFVKHVYNASDADLCTGCCFYGDIDGGCTSKIMCGFDAVFIEIDDE